jgi:tripartite-type tricarboxylate transporter receptor subunit TctC
MARVSAGVLTERLGQSVVVENRPGAGGMLGTDYAVKAAPDGYTLLLVAGSYTVNPALYKLSFDPVADISPVIQLSRGAYVLCVHPKVPARNLQELLALARKDPGKLTFASSGAGGHLHVVTEYMLDMAKVKATHVPYKGTGPAINDLLAGNVDMLFAGTEALMQHVKAGKLRALVVGTAKRLAAYPDIPSVAESGLPDYDVVAWHGLVAPRGVPPAIIARINAELNAGLKVKEMEARLEPTGVGAAGGTPEQFGALLQAEIVRYSKVIRDAGIKATE